MTDIILKAEHLKKVFVSGKKSMTAVDDVSFELNRGECLGICLLYTSPSPRDCS